MFHTFLTLLLNVEVKTDFTSLIGKLIIFQLNFFDVETEGERYFTEIFFFQTTKSMSLTFLLNLSSPSSADTSVGVPRTVSRRLVY